MTIFCASDGCEPWPPPSTACMTAACWRCRSWGRCWRTSSVRSSTSSGRGIAVIGGVNAFRVSRDDGKALKRNSAHVCHKEELDELDALDTAAFSAGAHILLLERKPGGCSAGPPWTRGSAGLRSSLACYSGPPRCGAKPAVSRTPTLPRVPHPPARVPCSPRVLCLGRPPGPCRTGLGRSSGSRCRRRWAWRSGGPRCCCAGLQRLRAGWAHV